MAMRFICDRCGSPIPSSADRLKLVIDEFDMRADLCSACADSLRAWIRKEPNDPIRSLTT
jgi:hypothetical protein